MKRYHICLSGSGGQGLILAGVLLAHAAVSDGKCVTMTSSYGPEARGGASRSSLVISEKPIDYPLPCRLDVLLTMNQESCNRYASHLKEDGILIVDSTRVIHQPPIRHYSVPFTSMASQAGAVLAANVTALGTIIGLTGIVRPASLEIALRARIKEEMLPLNEKLLKLGLKEGRKLKSHSNEYYTY
ncbi:MAG: 2-oxoacid:acceptor oxidoreductase family protein [ANME-2 cluster archaeon]|nr:2-oxoacid:acceptor oxidoreductase family protein [ANME-2 cluster archaeon]